MLKLWQSGSTMQLDRSERQSYTCAFIALSLSVGIHTANKPPGSRALT